MTSTLLEVRNVTKRFGTHTALEDVSLSVPKGSIFGLLGPNGAGKTTLIRIINQITLPDQGGVFLNGMPLDPSHIGMIGYLPEERGLYKSMKVGEQALYLAQLKGLTKAEAKKRIVYWFEKFGILSWWDKKIQELSKGMAQKVQFVVTVLHEPTLLIFDEPFSGFDPVNANLIKDEILGLQEKGATVIFSTHRMESVEELCDHIALIDTSKKILDGPIQTVKNSFRTNTFEVRFKPRDTTEFFNRISADFGTECLSEVQPDTFLKLKHHLGTLAKPNDLLQFLIANGEVNYFAEIMPTINDIFIKTVGKYE